MIPFQHFNHGLPHLFEKRVDVLHGETSAVFKELHFRLHEEGVLLEACMQYVNLPVVGSVVVGALMIGRTRRWLVILLLRSIIGRGYMRCWRYKLRYVFSVVTVVGKLMVGGIISRHTASLVGGRRGTLLHGR